jgi:hypothetical protein
VRGRRARRDAGQGTLEYIAVLAIVALVVSLVLATNPGGVVTSGTRDGVNDILTATATGSRDGGAGGAGAPGGAPVGGEPGVEEAGGEEAGAVVLASVGGGEGWRRVVRDVCVVLVLVCGNLTNKNPLDDVNVPKPPSVQERENREKREEETQPRQPQPEPSSGETLPPDPLADQQPRQAPPIGDEDEETGGALAWVGDAARWIGNAVVVVVGGVLTVLSWLLPRPQPV